ncbi:putative ABC transport system permease protein [Ochrobactrum daejeonense]|uniref:Putative ABC transport system permease protein n=1 Tax=Brucella daejeonensis TaxID=659015 RepID=A0A7W9EJJ3_9HYPH|nr:ABC transporter permease [Brucella daejeonensis]MBB5700273.1 putative ABC transport system permease protein [Brucella daejeonensis]
MSFTKSMALALRFALREMRGGLSGFYIFLACIALGVAAIGGVNSVARSVSTGIAAEGQSILGGDVSFALNQREATREERAFIENRGRLAESATMRSMARIPDGSDQSLVEVKAVDAAYPLYGTVKVSPQQSLADMTGERAGAYGAAVTRDFLDRMGLSLGAKVLLGSETFELRALIESEPDLLSSGFNFAPRFLVSLEALRASGLIQPGSLVHHIYKVALAGGAPDSAIADVRRQAAADFPDAGWNIRSRSNAAPALSANIERFSQFLTLVGLTALIVGGVGVANAVRAYLDGKRGVIATFKSLGAPARFAVLVYLVQIMVIGFIGIVIGLFLAMIIPYAAALALANYLPVADGGFFPAALALAAVFGLITTLAFAIIPLGRARDIPATALFREQGFEQRGWPALLYLGLAVLLIAALAALALYVAYDRRIAAIFIVSAIAAFGVLRLVADGIRWLARRAPRVRSTALRLALGNIHRPGALTPSVVLSLGLGLTLMVAIALIDGNLRRQVTENIPAQAPDFFFVDIQNRDIGDFTRLVSGIVPDGKLTSGPMLRGRIVAFNGRNVRDMTIPPEAAWVLRGDRGITFADSVPENSTLTEGEWWPAGYGGEPLVSFAEREGKELGLKLGDTVTVNVLGRNITARIASFRQLQWETLAMNFVMVFSPNTFAGAPATWLATLTIPDAEKNLASDVLRQVTKTWPAVTTVSVTDALNVANDLIGQLGVAIRAAASIALAASVLVLGGALAAGNRARVHDAVVLKTLGATRSTLITAYVLEYMLLGLATAIFALVAGSVAGWYVVAQIMKLKAGFLPDVALMTVGIALVLTVGFGLAGTWRVLGQKPAQVLRTI